MANPAPSLSERPWHRRLLARRDAMPSVGRVDGVALLVPSALALAYVTLLVVRFPQLIRWGNGDSDIVSAFLLTNAISFGHTGHVVISTQGSWVPLLYGLLTHGLAFHRVLWEISPALLSVAAAVLIGVTVTRLSDPLRGALATGLFVAASPLALLNFTAAFHHNTTIPGAALLGSYLVWVGLRPRGARELVASGLAVGVVVGAFVASDELLAIVGLLPFVGAAVLRWARTRDAAGLAAVIGVTVLSVVLAAVLSRVMHSLGFATTTPALHVTKHVSVHVRWLVQGLLRIGNGISTSVHRRIPRVLAGAAAVVTFAGLLTLCWQGVRRLVRPQLGGLARASDLYVLYWAGSFLCAAAAYVVTTAARTPTDRYLLVAVPAVAAVVPLAIKAGRSAWLTAVGASVFIVASVLALRAGEVRSVIYDGASTSEAPQIASYVRSHHLGVGYAGYWDAANLDWVTDGRVDVYPVTDHFGPVEPMYQTRVSSWYSPRALTPSFLLLAPYDLDLRDRLPPGLPRPQREVQIGPVTLAVYPYDIARFFHAPSVAPGS